MDSSERTIAVLERLAAAGIQLAEAGLPHHFLAVREDCAALVQRTPEDGFGPAGSPCRITPTGLAALVSRGSHFYFVAKNFESPASTEEVQSLRRFAADLANCLESPA